MMKLCKSLVLLLVAVAVPVLLGQEAPAAADALPESPLVVNGSRTPEIDLGRVFKLAQHIFPVVIENPSDEPVEYTGIIVNCNCTRPLGKVPSAGVIPAHGKLAMNMQIGRAHV